MEKSNLDKFYDLIDKIEIAMLTTRRTDGLLVSRPMATQALSTGADLWFVTTKTSPKVTEIGHDPNVNLSYYKDRTREWISVAGSARLVTDRGKIHELYRPDWRAWFGDEGGPKDGTPDDPRIILIGIDIRIAHYLELNKPQAVVLFEVVKGMVTGKAPNMPETREVLGEEFR
jgi:general stress protein 26